MRLSKKNLLKILGLEYLFIVLFFLISKFFIERFREVLTKIQDVNYELGGIDSALSFNKTDFDALAIQGNLDLLNSYFTQLFLHIFLGVLVAFLLYIIIKSLLWNLICNNKLENYRKYFFKFLGLTLIASILIVPIGFSMLGPAREFLLEYMFGGVLLWKSLLVGGFYFILTTLIIYFLFTGYVYINKMNFLKSLKEIFLFRKLWLYLVFLLIFFVIFLIIRISNLINVPYVSPGIQVILIGLIFIWYKTYLVKELG